MKDRYVDGDDFETPDQTRPETIHGRFRTHIQDEDGDTFEVEIDYCYREFLGEVADFEASVKPMGPCSMSVEDIKESAKYAIYDETQYQPDQKQIIILTK